MIRVLKQTIIFEDSQGKVVEHSGFFNERLKMATATDYLINENIDYKRILKLKKTWVLLENVDTLEPLQKFLP